MALRALADKKVLRSSSLNERNNQGLVQWKWNDGTNLVDGGYGGQGEGQGGKEGQAWQFDQLQHETKK